MLVLALEVLAGLGVLFAVAVLVTGRGALMAPAPADRAPLTLPGDRAMTGGDLAGLRFGVALRGYRMSDVDEVLDRVASEIEARDARIAALAAAAGDPTDGPADGPSGGEQEWPDEDADRTESDDADPTEWQSVYDELRPQDAEDEGSPAAGPRAEEAFPDDEPWPADPQDTTPVVEPWGEEPWGDEPWSGPPWPENPSAPAVDPQTGREGPWPSSW